VPLDGSHFLAISTPDPGGYDSHIYLAATVVATDPRVAQRASEQLQAQISSAKSSVLRVRLNMPKPPPYSVPAAAQNQSHRPGQPLPFAGLLH
jgi:hypothetical protein